MGTLGHILVFCYHFHTNTKFILFFDIIFRPPTHLHKKTRSVLQYTPFILPYLLQASSSAFSKARACKSGFMKAKKQLKALLSKAGRQATFSEDSLYQEGAPSCSTRRYNVQSLYISWASLRLIINIWDTI